MNKIKQVIAGSLFSLAALGSSGAWADCVQANFQGVYQAIIATATPPGQVLWAQCRVSIDAAGIVAATTCTTSAAPTTNLPLTTASVKLAAGGGPLCTFTGSFKIATTTYAVKQITLSDDHLYAKGVGTSPVPLTVDLIRIN